MSLKRAVLVLIAVAVGLVVLPPSPADAASLIRIVKVQYDSPGSDTGSNTSLNGEWVAIRNTGTTRRDLTHWTLRDAANHVYTFGSFSLKAGGTVYVKTGTGTNNAVYRYQNRGWYVWNNTGDTA